MRTSKANTISTIQLTKAAIFIALMAIGANLTAFITIGTVPLTFQTVIAILAGITLGKKVGAFSMVGYVVVGLVGAPVTAGFQGGMQIITLPTFGFLLSFIALAFFVGLIIEKTKKVSLFTYILVAYVGLLINYGIGIPYLYLHTNFIVGTSEVPFITIALSMTPFFVKDVILGSLTAVACPRIMRALHYANLSEQNTNKQSLN